MSIFFDFDVGCKGRRFRRAVDQDKIDIALFWDRDLTKHLFREDNIGSLIELSNLSICMINGKMEVIGFIALSDYPTSAGIDPNEWENWIAHLFQRRYLPRQTLFINFMCCDDSVTDYFLEEALSTVFLNDVYLQQIILLVPPGCPDEVLLRYQSFKRRNFFKFFSKEDEFHSFHCLLVAMEKDFCPALKCRRAVEEDNDDIVEILETKCEKLKDLYGEYYISEIIGRHPENNRQLIVAQLHDKVVGVMCLNSDVNLESLQSIYELNSFHGLIKASPLEKELMNRKNALLQQFGDPIMLGKWSPFETIAAPEVSNIDDDGAGASREKINLPFETRVGKVLFHASGVTTHSIIEHFLGHSSSEESIVSLRGKSSDSGSVDHDLGLSITCLLDEEPFDYEIVNIDKHLIHEAAVNFSSIELTSKYVPHINRESVQYQNRRRRSSMKFEESIPVYKGSSNAFVIELFGLKEIIDDRLGFYLLLAAFECMSTYDYCIIRVRTSEKSFALLQHFCFVPIRTTVCCEYALYLAHRNSVMGSLRVRKAEFADIPRISMLLNNLDAKETIYTVEHNIGKKHSNNAYVLICDNTVIGLAVLGQPEQVDYVRTKFSVDTHLLHRYHVSGQGLNNGFATLKCLVVSPVFEPHFRFFARELMRTSGSSVIMWLTAYRNKWVVHKANAMASNMIPVMPLRSNLSQIIFSEYKSAKKEFQASKNNGMAFSTWFLSNKYTSVQKINVDTRIVIVGASNTAMAFINELLFSDSSVYLNFTSVTFVSPYGLPYLRHSFPAAETMFPRSTSSSDKSLKSIPYTYYLNIIQGTMIEINKQEQYIKLENGQKVFFDLLFLLLGKQYQHPEYMEALLERERLIKSDHPPPYIGLDVPRYIETEPHYVDYDTPDNVFIINSITEASKALHYIISLMSPHRDYVVDFPPVIVYGTTLEAYCCISALLEINVPPKCIVLIEPFPPEDETKPRVPFFSNIYVDESVKQVLESLGITTYTSHYFNSWTVIDNLAVEVEFLSYLKAVKLSCCALFYYGKRGLNSQAFVAINKSGIAYDGGILIDHEFRTNHPSIYSAGSVTRYYRRYYANSMCQKYYNSAEIGQKLGAQIRNQLDPLFKESEQVNYGCLHCLSVGASVSSSKSSDSYSKIDEESRLNWRLPELKKPLIWHCTLPGGMNYLEVRPPGKKVPHHYIQSLTYNGFVMETFKKGYFKLHFTTDFVLNGITCLTPETYSLESFKHLYGLSAVTLNNVHYRYTAKKVTDFFEFFLSPWAIFLYHDHIEDFMSSVKELFPKGHTKGKTLEDALRKIANSLEKASPTDTKEDIRANFEKSPHFEVITDYVMDWLAENDILLPMYLQPNRLIEYSFDLARHPAFRKRKISAEEIVNAISK